MKKYLFGIFAVVLAVTISAFTPAKQTVKALDNEVWFVYDGGGESTLTNYHYDVSRQEIECGDQNGNLCLILAQIDNPLADPENWKPNLSTKIYDDRDQD